MRVEQIKAKPFSDFFSFFSSFFTFVEELPEKSIYRANVYNGWKDEHTQHPHRQIYRASAQ